MGDSGTCATRSIAAPALWRVPSGLQPGRGASQGTSVRQSSPWNVRQARAPNQVDRRQREHRACSRRSSTSEAAWIGRFGRDRANLRPQHEILCRRNNPRNSHPNTTRRENHREQKAAEQDAIRWQTPCRSLRAFVSPFRPAQHRGSIFSGARHLTSSICRFARCSPPFSVSVRTIDSELRLVAALRRAARERGGPLPSTDVADALLDERCDLTQGWPSCDFHNFRRS